MVGIRFFVCRGKITTVSSDTIRRHKIHSASLRPFFHKYFVPCVVLFDFFYVWGWDSVVDLMTRLGARLPQESWLDSRRIEGIFILSLVSRQSLGRTYLPIQ